VPTLDRRDPRFSSLSGHVNADLHARGYDFLPGMQAAEVDNLRKAVSGAFKAERNCKLLEKPRFTAERERLEAELARARSKHERTKRENREREVLAKVKREEREKRESGKGAWYMKKGEWACAYECDEYEYEYEDEDECRIRIHHEGSG
jgi:ribosomal RNA-processing protein 36